MTAFSFREIPKEWPIFKRVQVSVRLAHFLAARVLTRLSLHNQ